jgi:hypothetical protein
MSIKNLNLFAHATSAVLPMMTRTGSIPCIVDTVTSILPTIIYVLSGLSHYLRSHGEHSQFLAKFSWYLVPECLKVVVPKILGKETTLLADAGVLAAGAIASFRSLQIGITGRDRTFDIPYTSMAQRAVFSFIGITGLAQVADTIKNLSIGLFAVQSLDPEQKYFVLKHRSLETLGGPAKNCRAVIIDGFSSEWGNSVDDHSHPLAEELYRNCLVRTYRIDPNSTVPVCDAAEKGKKAIGGPLDILALLGHGNTDLITLNKRTDFTGSSHQTACLRDHLQPDAQMILAGCNTATGTNSLAEKASRHLNGIEVVGFSAYFSPNFCTTSWDGKKLSLWNYWPKDSQENRIFLWTNIARIFKSTPS